jgi:hypothetical protein
MEPAVGGSALADERERFAGLELEAHPVDGTDLAHRAAQETPAHGKEFLQASDLEDGRGAGVASSRHGGVAHAGGSGGRW